ncbi:MAG: NAD-dependent epimerase/dehydratase family protein [Bacteroidota bacterium]
MSATAKKIFVTGGTGFLGSYLLRMLVEKDPAAEIIALRRTSSSLDMVGDAAARIQWIEGDMLDYLLLEDVIGRVQEIYHCAATVSFDPRDQEHMRRINVEGTENLVNATLYHQSPRLVHVSSVAAIGRRKDIGIISEDTKWESSTKNSYYAITKYQSEMEVWRGITEGLNAAIVNPSIILGSGFWDRGTGKIIRNAWREFPFYPAGASGFVDVRDVADFMIRLMAEGIQGHRYLLNSTNLGYGALFSDLANRLGKKPPRVKVNWWIKEAAWRAEWLRTRLTGGTPFITKETANNSMESWEFNAQKSLQLPGFSYRPLEQTLEETCRQFVESQQLEQGFHRLPI